MAQPNARGVHMHANPVQEHEHSCASHVQMPVLVWKAMPQPAEACQGVPGVCIRQQQNSVRSETLQTNNDLSFTPLFAPHPMCLASQHGQLINLPAG